MSNLEAALVGIAAVLVIGLLYNAYQTIKRFLVPLRRIANAATFISQNKKALLQLPQDIKEALEGANKINQDSVKANAALANEVVKMRSAIDRFATMVVPPHEEQAVMTPQILQERFENTYSDLLEQGLDPELAKLKAAEYELEALSGGVPEELGIGA